MNNECGIIDDLLPLYIDGVCSEESKCVIENHIKMCERCRSVLENMKEQNNEKEMMGNVSIPESKNVIKEFTHKINQRLFLRAVGITLIILYWLVYIWQDRLSKLGDYRYFSYTFHEIYASGTLLIPLLSLLWIIIHIISMIKNKSWRKGVVMLVLLVGMTGVQGGYILHLRDVRNVTTWGTVEEVIDEYHILFYCGEEVILSCEPAVIGLLKTDGTEYTISYEIDIDKPSEGYLCRISE